MFEGLSVAMVTPFRGGAVDRESTERLVEHMITGGVHGLVVSGSTGEAATCSLEERRELWRFVKERARGRVWVVAGTGTNNTAESIANTRIAEELGLDGAMVVTPYYNKPTPKGQAAHFAAVAKSTRLPLILYNVPGRTATNTVPETLAMVQDLPNVKAEHQRPIGKHLGHRARQDEAQGQQRHYDKDAEHQQRMGENVVAERPAVGKQAKAEASQSHHAEPPHPRARLTAVLPAARGRALAHIFTPFSVKYFTAPGCHGIGESFFTWLSSAMALASPCTAIRSSRCSMKVLTMS
jgi:hypothetical protein